MTSLTPTPVREPEEEQQLVDSYPNDVLIIGVSSSGDNKMI